MEFDWFKVVNLRASRYACPIEAGGKNCGSKIEKAEVCKAVEICSPNEPNRTESQTHTPVL